MECRTCSIQYVGSTGSDSKGAKFRWRSNNYTSQYHHFVKGKAEGTLGRGKAPSQACPHSNFSQDYHNGIHDFSFQSARNLMELRKRESFWQYKRRTFTPEALNDRNITTYCAFIHFYHFAIG